jgi:hypothetical protein
MTALTTQEIDQYLTTRSDFDLELFAYRTLIATGYTATHSGTYVDPITAKYRQFDVRGWALPFKDWNVYLAVECKSLTTESPLVISRVPRPDSDSFHEVMSSTLTGNTPLFDVIRQDVHVTAMPVYPSGKFVGKRMNQPRKDKTGGFKDDERDSYDKWAQALSSAAAMMRDHVTATKSAMLAVVLPILLLNDDTLWTADYAEDGTRVGNSALVDEAAFFVDREFECSAPTSQVRYHMSHVHILTRRSFSGFIVELARSRGFLLERIFGNTERLLSKRAR